MNPVDPGDRLVPGLTKRQKAGGPKPPACGFRDSKSRRKAPLLDFDGGTSLFKQFLGLFGLGLGDAFLERVGGTFHGVLCLL